MRQYNRVAGQDGLDPGFKRHVASITTTIEVQTKRGELEKGEVNN